MRIALVLRPCYVGISRKGGGMREETKVPHASWDLNPTSLLWKPECGFSENVSPLMATI